MRSPLRLAGALLMVLSILAAVYLPAHAFFSGSDTSFLPVVTRPAGGIQGTYTYRFSIDRSATPPLYYGALSLTVHVGPATALSATIDGAPLEAVYRPATGDYVLTTDKAGVVAVRFTSLGPVGEVTVRKAALKGDRAWAWSHGMDDNVNLQAQVALLKARGWRASLMLIAKEIDDTRNEGWILDKPALRALLDQGWSLADHTWDHNCDHAASAADLRQTMLDGYAKLMEIVSTSNTRSYQIAAFAAPCFISEYDPIFDQVRAAGSTTLRLSESQGSPLMHVDGADYTSGGVTASAMSGRDTKIGRDTTIETDPAHMIATFAWMAANKAPDRHFWVNSLSHGNQEANLGKVIDAAYSAYGPGGSDELWMAPSDEIYSYLLVRDSATVAPGSLALAAP